MRKTLVVMAMIVLFAPSLALAQDSRATLDSATKALGADGLSSLQLSGTGSSFAAGQSAAPGAPWPRFTLNSFTRQINYDTASLRDDLTRTRAEMPPRGGGTPVMGELRQILVVSGDQAWNVAGETATSAPIALVERQLQLWTTPHGFVRAARANGATVSGRTVSFTLVGKFMVKGTSTARAWSTPSTPSTLIPSSATWPSRSSTRTTVISTA